LLANPATFAAIGKPAEAVLGKTDAEFYDDPATGRAMIENDRRIMDSGKMEVVEESISDEKGRRVFLSTKAPFYDPDGQVIGLVGVTRDITERKAAEEALAETALKLERSNQELEQFAFIASHDLQEPLRKVQVFGSLLKSSYSQEIGDQGLGYIERMQQAAGRMTEMLNGLLSYARITSQGQPFTPVDLQQVVDEVLYDLEARLMQTGGQVEVDPLPVIEADPLQMRQLFQNLLGNALKFHRPDVPPQVKISCSPAPENCVVLTITDNGIGFDEQQAGKLFKPFHRLHAKSEYEGSGVGLAICHKIVERHAGKITANSQPGVGTTFQVTLPIQPAR
jgi:PAS domain S-box-containing protein